MADIVQQRLETLRKRNLKNPSAINKDLFRLLCRKDFLSACYQSIKSNSGNMTPRIDTETLDEYSEEVLEKARIALKDQSWQFKPVRKIYIPKANGKVRPLGVPAPRDKIVQKGIETILSAIYEPSFSNLSHGFRIGRSCHSTLRFIKTSWSEMKWVIEGDIESCYDNLDHSLLIEILRRKIQDERFLNLIWKLLRAGYEEEGLFKLSNKGCSQGGIVSSVLANIYLHDLDIFVESLISQYNVGERQPNQESHRSRGKHDRLRFYQGTDVKSLPCPKSEIPLHEIPRLTQEMKKVPSKDPRDENYQKLSYVRYSDDWVIGIIGSKKFAEIIREQIRVFCIEHLKLTLSTEKTRISHFSLEGANFLGFHIKCGQTGIYSERSTAKDLFGNSKSIVCQPRLFVPMDKIVKHLSERNFCTSQGFPLKKKGWIVYEDNVIINRYNSLIRGLRNYYALADNLGTSMNRINYILKYSCAHTLAAKHRTRVSTQLLRKDSNSIKVLLDELPARVNPWDFRTEKVNDMYFAKTFA